MQCHATTLPPANVVALPGLSDVPAGVTPDAWYDQGFCATDCRGVPFDSRYYAVPDGFDQEEHTWVSAAGVTQGQFDSAYEAGTQLAAPRHQGPAVWQMYLDVYEQCGQDCTYSALADCAKLHARLL